MAPQDGYVRNRYIKLQKQRYKLLILLETTFVRNSKFPATGFAAAGKKFTTVFGGHALPKTKFVFAAAA